MILSAMPMRARDADEDDGLPCPGRAAPLTRGAFSLMTYTSGSRRRWQPLLLPLQPAILRAHNTSVGTPLAGMNDLNLGIHLHKHTKQPTLLKTSLSCSVNYFVIKSYLARSPDSMGKYDSMHAGSHNSLLLRLIHSPCVFHSSNLVRRQSSFLHARIGDKPSRA